MKKHILFSFIALSVLMPLTAKKTPLDYEKLASTGTVSEIKSSYSKEKSLFYKKYFDSKETFLQLCLKNNREFDIIKMCISYESDIESKTKDGKTPLMYASQYSSYPDVVELLIKTDALTSGKKRKRILQKDNSGLNSFHYAKMNSCSDIYAKLSEFAEDPDRNAAVETVPAAAVDDIAAVEAELKREAEELEAMTYRPETAPAAPVAENIPAPETASVPAVEVPENAGETVADSSIVDEPVVENLVSPQETVAQYLKKKEVETYASAFLYDYAEEAAEKQEEKKIVAIENPNLADKNGVTLLMKAAKSGNDWDVRTLLASGADVNLRDKDGWSALMYACRYQNNLNIVDMLIEKGAYIRTRNKFNATPLLMAADYSKNPEIIAVLLKNRTASEDEVFRAFIFSITGNTGSSHVRTAKVKLFLDMNVPLNRLWKGQTPLMYAAQYCSSTEVIQQLLDAGADPETVNDKGMTAFDYAKNNKRLQRDDSFWALNTSRK